MNISNNISFDYFSKDRIVDAITFLTELIEIADDKFQISLDKIYIDDGYISDCVREYIDIKYFLAEWFGWDIRSIVMKEIFEYTTRDYNWKIEYGLIQKQGIPTVRVIVTQLNKGE